MARYLPLLMLFAMASCSTTDPLPPTVRYQHVVNTQMASRNAEVPITLVVPRSDHPLALVIMAHGHGGSRQEGGGYEQMAEALAERGIASIRMDFPGCGESLEPFTENNLTNMIEDMKSARTYAEEFAEIDQSRIGLLGYSMGGRVVSLLSEIDPSYRAMALWTPAVSPGADRELSSLGGPDTYYELREKARATGVATRPAGVANFR